MPDFDTVLFDLGGVLTSDPWESLLLTPGEGIADRLGISRGDAKRVGEEMWEKYSLRPASEHEYWSELSSRLGVDVPPDLPSRLEPSLLVANPAANEVIDEILARGLSVGLVSETTSFWYPKQERLLNLERVVDSALLFLSFRQGTRKDVDEGGLFEIAARHVVPERSLVVDDRAENLGRARRHGFEAWEYSMNGRSRSFHTFLDLLGSARGSGV
jgi:FMN phosphatase YigB (HAD superfamily)